MLTRLRHLPLALYIAALLVFSCDARAAERILTFHAVTGDDIPLVQEILNTDTRMGDLIARDYILIPDDIRITKSDLDDSGKEEVLLLIKHNGDKPCTENPCEFQIWKKEDAWKKIGSYQMKEENLHLYDETYNGFHELANSQGVIPWYDE